MSSLTDRQKLTFKRNGFLVVQDALPADLVERARETVWDAIDVGRDDVSLLDAEDQINAWNDAMADGPFGEANARAHEYASELVGDALAEPGDGTQIALRFPDGEVGGRARGPTDLGGHLDGYGPGFNSDGEVRSFTVAASMYLEDAPPRGGGFTVWPGSHWAAARYFSCHALETIGHADHGDYDTMVPGDVGDPFECAGEAGDMVLWHNKLVHTGGVNHGDGVRMAAITRMSREDLDEIRRDAADKPFKYWDGLDGVVQDSPPNPYAGDDGDDADGDTDHGAGGDDE